MPDALVTAFLTGHIAATAATSYVPSQTWFTAFTANEAAIRANFSQEADGAFHEVQILIGPSRAGGLGALGQYGVHDFIERKDRALKKFYSEVY